MSDVPAAVNHLSAPTGETATDNTGTVLHLSPSDRCAAILGTPHPQVPKPPVAHITGTTVLPKLDSRVNHPPPEPPPAKSVIGHGLMLSLSIAKWRDLLNCQSPVYDGDRQAPPDLLNLLAEGTESDPDK